MENCTYYTNISKRGRQQPENYRPISLTCIICKVMESIIRGKIIEHINKNSLFSVHQHWFLKGRSCATQLLCVYEEWSTIIDNNVCFDSVYFVFAKAFHTVPHLRFLKRKLNLRNPWKLFDMVERLLVWQKTKSSCKWNQFWLGSSLRL